MNTGSFVSRHRNTFYFGYMCCDRQKVPYAYAKGLCSYHPLYGVPIDGLCKKVTGFTVDQIKTLLVFLNYSSGNVPKCPDIHA